MLAALGPDATRLIHLPVAFSRPTAEGFVAGLAAEARRLSSVCVGQTFTFGYRREGNADVLRCLGEKSHFSVTTAEDVALDERPVSSTRIREAVRDGALEEAGRMLGRPYSLCGVVERGAGRGRELGFPTANLDVNGLAVPQPGVYTAQTEATGAVWRAAVNIGFRPTIAAEMPALSVEAHLLDFDGDLYGRELELTFGRKLRDERKFSSLAALQEQVAADIAETRKM